MTYIQEAFKAKCKEAKSPSCVFLSLYQEVPFFGGYAEGGWWGHDTILVSYQEFPTEELAEAAKIEVEKLAQELNKESKKSYGEQCLRETAWLEARGLDDSFLPEPDGETTYFVQVENELGRSQRFGNRYYE
jgi:hypothetical protein